MKKTGTTLLCVLLLSLAPTVHAQDRTVETLQKLADAALMQMNIEFGGDAVTQVGTAPAYHAVGLAIRAVLHPLRHLAQLGFGQTRLTPRARAMRE